MPSATAWIFAACGQWIRSLPGLSRRYAFVNDEIGYWDHAGKARVINEIAYTDESGQEQFLQRTLLAGAQKFNKRFSQRLPQKVLDIFRSHINYVQKLYVVGYSFGDAHIDLVLRNWLEFSGERSAVIVDPGRRSIPAHLAHLALQIEIKNQTAGHFSRIIVRSR